MSIELSVVSTLNEQIAQAFSVEASLGESRFNRFLKIQDYRSQKSQILIASKVGDLNRDMLTLSHLERLAVNKSELNIEACGFDIAGYAYLTLPLSFTSPLREEKLSLALAERLLMKMLNEIERYHQRGITFGILSHHSFRTTSDGEILLLDLVTAHHFVNSGGLVDPRIDIGGVCKIIFDLLDDENEVTQPWLVPFLRLGMDGTNQNRFRKVDEFLEEILGAKKRYLEENNVTAAEKGAKRANFQAIGGEKLESTTNNRDKDEVDRNRLIIIVFSILGTFATLLLLALLYFKGGDSLKNGNEVKRSKEKENIEVGASLEGVTDNKVKSSLLILSDTAIDDPSFSLLLGEIAKSTDLQAQKSLVERLHGTFREHPDETLGILYRSVIREEESSAKIIQLFIEPILFQKVDLDKRRSKAILLAHPNLISVKGYLKEVATLESEDLLWLFYELVYRQDGISRSVGELLLNRDPKGFGKLKPLLQVFVESIALNKESVRAMLLCLAKNCGTKELALLKEAQGLNTQEGLFAIAHYLNSSEARNLAITAKNPRPKMERLMEALRTADKLLLAEYIVLRKSLSDDYLALPLRESFTGIPGDSEILDLIIDLDDPYIVLRMIEGVGEKLSIRVLFKLLQSKDAPVRSASLKLLELYNEPSIVGSVRRQFRLEKDEEVIKAYESFFAKSGKN
jgi:hypothetical protein